MRTKRGFTLVEVIVAITILGLITLLALPVINSVSYNLNNKKYETYLSYLESSAKLYLDSNSMDMFGNQNNGCYDIKYAMLSNKKLIEDIDMNDVSCANMETFVRVNKINDVYIYTPNLVCYKGEKEVYKKVESTESVCEDGNDTNGPEIIITPDGDNTYSKTFTVKVKIKDDNGLAENQKIKYMWVNKDDGTVASTKTYDYKNKYMPVLNASVETTIETPNNITGKYVLKVEPIKLMDAIANTTTETKESNNFYFDNTPPTEPTIVGFITDSSTSPISESGLTSINTGRWTTKNVYLKAKNSIDSESGGVYYEYNIANTSDIIKKDNIFVKNTGMNMVRFRACDRLNNCSNYNVFSANIDRTPPTCGTISGASTEWTRNDRVIGVGCSDSESGCPGNTIQKPFSETASTGKIEISDNAGNKRNCTVNVYIDKDPPVIFCTQSYTLNDADAAGYGNAANVCRRSGERVSRVYYCKITDNVGLAERSVTWGGSIEIRDKGRYNSASSGLSGTSVEDHLCHDSGDSKISVYARDAVGNEARINK